MENLDPTKMTPQEAEPSFKKMFDGPKFLFNRLWKVVNLNINNTYTYTWEVALSSKYALIQNLTPAFRNMIQQLLPKSLIIKTFTMLYNECDDAYFKIKLIFKAPTRRLPTSKISQNKINTSSIDAKSDTTYRLLVQNKSDKIKYVISLDEYNEKEHYPCHLIQGWTKIVTKRFTGRQSLSVKVWNFIKDKLHLGANCVRQTFNKFLQTIKPVKTGPIIFVPQEEVKINRVAREPNYCGKMITNAYSAVPYNYNESEHMYQLTKLSDTKIFYMVRRHLIQTLGIPGYGTMNIKSGPQFSSIEIANYLRSVGLPLDESLRELYFEYCKMRNICKDATLELKEYALSIC